MAVYEFKCPGCAVTASVATAIASAVINPVCIACNQPMQRDYSFGAIQFKGKGFYTTDRQS